MFLLRAGSPSAKSWPLVVAAAAFALVLGLPTLGAPGSTSTVAIVPTSPTAAPSVPSPAPSGGGPLPGPSPEGAQSYPNGSPFLEGPSGGAWHIDDNVLPEQYATPGASGLVDTYLLQRSLPADGSRVELQIDQGPGYSTSLDSVELGYALPGTEFPGVTEGSQNVYGAVSQQNVACASDGGGANVTTLLLNPSANGTTPNSTFLTEASGAVVLGSFGDVAGANQEYVVLRAQEDPAYPPSGASGIGVEVGDPSTGGFSSIGFVAPREYFSDFILPIGSALASGTQPVVVRLIWQGTHELAWLALEGGVSNLPLTPTTLVSAVSGTGANWTQVLSATDGQSAVLPPDSSVNLTFGLASPLPSGAVWAFVTNGGSVPSGGGPQASFTMAPASPVVGQSVVFTSTSTDASYPLTSYAWSFGDGSSAITANASHSYAQAGNYSVTLTVSDAGGYFASASQLLTVLPQNGGGGGGGGGGLGGGAVCGGSFACYLVNVTLSVGGAPGSRAQLTVLDLADCGRGDGSREASPLPRDDGCSCGREGTDVAPLPSDDGNCCAPRDAPAISAGRDRGSACTTELWLNVTRVPGGTSTVGYATLMLPWNATRAPDLDDQFLHLNVTSHGKSTPVTVTLTTPFFQRTLAWTFHHHHRGGPSALERPLGPALGLVLAGGYLVTYDSSALPAAVGATSVGWAFSGPNPSGGRQHGCLYANLTCELLHAGVPLPPGFPRGTFDLATCTGLAGTVWDPLVCSTSSGAWTTHLFVWNGAYTVTVSIFGPNGSVTVVRAADAQIGSANGP